MAIFNSYVKLPEGNHWLKSAKYITPGAQVLITGASAGIGRDLALLLARQGANVALLARRGAAFAGGVVAQVDIWRSPEIGGIPIAEWFTLW